MLAMLPSGVMGLVADVANNLYCNSLYVEDQIHVRHDVRLSSRRGWKAKVRPSNDLLHFK